MSGPDTILINSHDTSSTSQSRHELTDAVRQLIDELESVFIRRSDAGARVLEAWEAPMKKLALALAATAALGIAAPTDAEAWGYRYGGWGYRHGGWGGVGAGLAIGALAGGLIAASTRAYAYPAYGYGGYYPASYGYGYPASYGYGYGYAPVHRVVVVRRRVVAPAYYDGYYPGRYGYGGYYGGYGVRRVGYYGGYYRPRVAHYGGYGVRRVGYYGGHGIRRGYGIGVGRVGRWR
jgi:hypothetical protein